MTPVYNFLVDSVEPRLGHLVHSGRNQVPASGAEPGLEGKVCEQHVPEDNLQWLVLHVLLMVPSMMLTGSSGCFETGSKLLRKD